MTTKRNDRKKEIFMVQKKNVRYLNAGKSLKTDLSLVNINFIPKIIFFRLVFEKWQFQLFA